MRRPGGGDGFQPGIAAHPMVDMHHQVTGREGVGLGQEVIRPAAFFRRPDQPVAQHVLFGDDGEPAALFKPRLEAVFQRPDREEHAAMALGHVAEIGDLGRRGQTLVGQQPLEPLARALGIGGDHHRVVFAFCPNMICQ